MKDIFGVVGTVSWFCATQRMLLISNSIISCCWQLTKLIYLNFAGVTSANMLIFILPSSLYLKITQQDGSKLTQRIWVCIPFPSVQWFHLVISQIQSLPSLDIHELPYVTFPPCFSQLAAALPFSFANLEGLPAQEPYYTRHLVFWRALQCRVRSSFPGWQAAALQEAIAVRRVLVPLQPTSARSPASLFHFSVLIQKVHKVLCLQYSSWF